MIPNLEDMSLGNRIALTVVIVVLVILLVAAVGFTTGRWEAEGQESRAKTSVSLELVRLDREALKQAYIGRIVALFDVWMRDDTEQPHRAIAGVRRAQKAYADAIAELDKFEAELNK